MRGLCELLYHCVKFTVYGFPVLSILIGEF